MNDQDLNYYSDEELEQLIQKTEQNGLHTAPGYLKNEILQKAFGNTSHTVLVDAEYENNKVRLFIYSLKVGLVTVAAIFLLFMVPIDEMGSISKNGTNEIFSGLTSSMNEKSNRLCDSMAAITNRLIIREKDR